ncbi:MAG: NAD-dependent dehydratase [Parcubacteria group bacterium]|nr:MAG: NAD-dependent dehydratase [Parcubacteria group bacterium]
MSKVYFESKNILVLGGAGFVGSHLCEALVAKGDNVVCVDNYISSDVENVRSLLEYPNFEFVRHDITQDIDYGILPELKKFKVDVQGFQEIYNLACPTAPRDFTKFPIETAEANSIGVIKSLHLAKKYRAKYLFTSSSAVYGEPPKNSEKINEDYYGLLDYLDPRACYNEGKRFAETLVTTFRDVHKIDTRIARLFGTYGPRMLMNSGRQIPDLIKAAVDSQELAVAGDDKTKISLCYVKDVVEGLLALMKSDFNQPINLGSEQMRTLKEVAERILNITKTNSHISFSQGYKHSMQPAIPDISLAKDELNWFPLVSLEEGLREAIEYYKATAFLRRPTVGYDTASHE